jgi:urease subunit alpha
MARLYEAFEGIPVNLGLQASARSENASATERVVEAGAVGLKIHEDWGAYPEVIDATLRVADAHDIAVCLHTDGLNESCELEDTVAAIGGRAVHAYHVEGVGGGHVPDLIGLVREPNVVCSSTTPTVPYGTHTASEHLQMILLVHGGSIDSPDDVAAARERIHPGTMAAEGPLHDLGAIGIVNSDSQGMGRIGETVRRTFQLADAMKAWRATDAGGGWPGADAGDDDNARVLRYLAKITAEPARVHGIEDEVGSLAPGRVADVVLWRPAAFGVRPEVVLKAGYWAWGALGEGNASVELAEPVRYRPHWGALGNAAASLGTTFVSRAALEGGFAERLGTRRRVVAVHGTRTVRRDGLHRNTAVANIAVDPAEGTVTLDGRVLASPPATGLPLNRRYLLG